MRMPVNIARTRRDDGRLRKHRVEKDFRAGRVASMMSQLQYVRFQPASARNHVLFRGGFRVAGQHERCRTPPDANREAAVVVHMVAERLRTFGWIHDLCDDSIMEVDELTSPQGDDRD